MKFDGRKQGGDGDVGVARVVWPLYIGPCGSAHLKAGCDP